MSQPTDLRDSLRHMLAVLQGERQALAGLDLDAIVGASEHKLALCDRIDRAVPADLDDECRGLLDAARRQNEVNRQVRNLIAANVAARLDALTGRRQTYHATPAYAFAGARG